MPPSQLKSEASTIKAFVRFVNKTQRRIDIIWVNFTGELVKYSTLSHDQFVDVDTFTKHPWIFVDSVTRDRMWVENQEVYIAKPWYDQYRRRSDPSILRTQISRVQVIIRIPLYSLKSCALLRVRSLLKNISLIESLELPLALRNDLIHEFEKQISVENYVLRR